MYRVAVFWKTLLIIPRFHLYAQKHSSFSCGKEEFCILCLSKNAESKITSMKVRNNFSLKLVQFSLRHYYRNCENKLDARHKLLVLARHGAAKWAKLQSYRFQCIFQAIVSWNNLTLLNKHNGIFYVHVTVHRDKSL